MLITRKKKVPLHWVFYAQLSFAVSIWAGFVTGAPFLLSMKKFIDNPAAITFLLTLDALFNSIGGSVVNWFSDRIWTRYGRRKVLIAASDIGKLCLMPLLAFAPNIWTLIILKWIYGLMGEFGTPNQALTMEVIPPSQRGLGSGFFQLQLNLSNIIFWGVVIGRFDDVYFLGPLQGVVNLSGECLMFLSASFLFFAIGIYTFFGIKEIEPPHHQSLRDERRPRESYLWTFVRSFFKDIFAKDLLPLYLLLFAGSMAGIGLGILGPLLYIDQWGYSTQDMGTNVAIGAVINIFIALLAGYFADASSKMRVYVGALIMGLVMKIVWVTYVYFKPDHRPELWELVVFGEVSAIFGMVAGVVSFPLILEYVERNRLGTAGAGMGIFRQILGSSISVFIGAWVVWWSVWFLPQAGDYVEVVFNKEINKAALVSELASAGLDLKDVHLEPRHRPGDVSDDSRWWCIRRHNERSSQLQSDKKEIENEIAKLHTSLQSPILSPEKHDAITVKLAAERCRVKEVEKELNDSARQFGQQVTGMVSSNLMQDGSQIVAASYAGETMGLDLDVVGKVSPKLAAKLSEMLESPEYVVEPDLQHPGEFRSKISVTPWGAPSNGIHVSATRDARFTALHRALLEKGVAFEDAYTRASALMEILRDGIGRAADSFNVSDVVIQATEKGGSRLALRIKPGGGAKLPQAKEIGSLFAQAEEIALASASDELGSVRLDLEFRAPFLFGSSTGEGAISRRIASLLDRDDAYARSSLERFYQHVVEAAAAAPVYLTVSRPVVKQTFADRVYDYFFSVYALMIMGDFFCFGVIFLIIRLEKRGVVHRLGVEEDANR